MALTTLTRLRTYLGQEYVTKEDTFLQDMLDAASAFFVREVGRAIEVATYTETVDGNGTSSMTLRASPVVSVSSVVVNGETIPERTSWDGTGWVLQGDRVRLVGYLFSCGVSNVVVTYSAGYSTIPDDVQTCVCELASLKRNEASRMGIFSRSIPGMETTQYQVITLPVSIQRVIDSYRLPVVV
jgi:hypothetical protein